MMFDWVIRKELLPFCLERYVVKYLSGLAYLNGTAKRLGGLYVKNIEADFVSNELDEKKIKSFYDDVYYQNIRYDKSVTKHNIRLAGKLQVSNLSNVLDVACGTGDFLRACSKLGAEVSGVDLSENAISACEKMMPKGDFYACSAEKLAFTNNSFDLITCLGSLEHFIDPVAALKEMVRVAKPDAQFVILVPNKDFLTRKLGLFRGTYQVDAKEVVRTLDEWDNLFNLAGIHVEKRWKDLHVLSWSWVMQNGWKSAFFRGAQALALTVWPLKWQYQVFHLARVK